MIAIKRHKHRDQSPTPPPPSSHKLFADYPYPIITELDNKIHKQRKSSDHSHTLVSLQWYKDSFYRLFGVSNNLHDHNPSTSILEQSFQQAHIDGSSSKVIVNNLQKQTKPTRIRRIFARSMNSLKNDQKRPNNKRHIRKITKTCLNHQIHDDEG